MSESVPLIPNAVNLITIFGETSFAGGFGIFYLYDHLNQNRPPGREYSEKTTRVINTYLHPDKGCEFIERSAELPPPSPLRICISPLD